MAIVYPVLQHRPALFVIKQMQHVLARRRNGEISRPYFLNRWGALRAELNDTEEYKTLRRKVYARSQGTCEKCKLVPGNQMCHKTAVAFRPELSLRLDNVYLGCDDCHQEDHPDLVLVK
jgi:hypothetical protein